MKKRTTFEISEQASKDFLRDAEGWNLDLSAMPSVAKSTDTSFEGHSLAPLVNDGSVRSVEFKKWLRKSQSDPEIRRVLDRAVSQGNLPREGDDDRSAKVYVIHGENVRVEPQRDGSWIARHNGKSFVGSDRETVAVMVSRDDFLSEPSDQDKLRIARYVSGVHTSTSVQQAEEIFLAAVKAYIRAASGPSDEAALADIRFLPLVNAAIQYCWGVVRNDFAPGADWQGFVNQYAGGRPFTIPLLDAARKAYESALEASRWTGMIEQKAPEPAPAPADIDDLSDEAVGQLYRGIAREAARQSRRPRFTANPSV